LGKPSESLASLEKFRELERNKSEMDMKRRMRRGGNMVSRTLEEAHE